MYGYDEVSPAVHGFHGNFVFYLQIYVCTWLVCMCICAWVCPWSVCVVCACMCVPACVRVCVHACMCACVGACVLWVMLHRVDVGGESTSLASVTNCTLPFPPYQKYLAPEAKSLEDVHPSDLHYHYIWACKVNFSDKNSIYWVHVKQWHHGTVSCLL